MTVDTTISDLQQRLAAADAHLAEQRQELAQLRAPEAVGGVRPVVDPAPHGDTGSVVDRVDAQARAIADDEGIKLSAAYCRIFASDHSNALGVAYATEQRARVKQARMAKTIASGGEVWR